MNRNLLKKCCGMATLAIMVHTAIAQKSIESWPVLKTYEGIYLDEVAMPLGPLHSRME